MNIFGQHRVKQLIVDINSIKTIMKHFILIRNVYKAYYSYRSRGRTQITYLVSYKYLGHCIIVRLFENDRLLSINVTRGLIKSITVGLLTLEGIHPDPNRRILFDKESGYNPFTQN